MHLRKLAFAALLTSSLVFVGCGDDDDGGTDGGMVDSGPGGDDGGDVDSGPSGPLPGECADGECIFVTNSVVIPDVDLMGGVEVANGFDIDMRVSDTGDVEGCMIPDFTAPDGREGIDNQLASLKPTLNGFIDGGLDATIEGALSDGDLILLMELTGAESTDDSDVTLSLFLGQTTDGAPPMLEGGSIAAGQTFNLDPASVNPDGSAVVSVPASTVAGSLAAGPIDIPLAFPLDETTTLTLNIRSASVSADIQAGALANGIIGGELIIDELITTVMAIGGDLPISVIQSTLESVADLSPDGDGVCQSLSVGIEFGAVDAVKGDVGT